MTSPHVIARLFLPDRRLYGDKELLTFMGYNTYDYSDRHYYAAASCFDNPDPKAHDYTWISPYTFCAGNPVRFIDEDGCRPVYSTTGEFLGTDDTGLQGELRVMEKDNFEQNMSTELANQNTLDLNSLSEEITTKINEHFSTLPSRPDYDGIITWSEAKEWYQEGTREALYAEADKMDIGNPSIKVGEEKVINTFDVANLDFKENGTVYGNIRVKAETDSTATIHSDTFDFDMHPWNGSILRNIFTLVGRIKQEKGNPLKFISGAQRN